MSALVVLVFAATFMASCGHKPAPRRLSATTVTFPGIVAEANLSGQTAAINATTIYTTPSSGAGVYRVSYYLVVSTGATGNINVNLQYYDGVASVGAFLNQNSHIPLTTLNNSAVTVLDGMPIVIYSAANQAISYSTQFVGVTGSPVYSLYIRLEYLGS